ncbi:MAG TPA: hypothetical protein DHM37_01665 [Candidatus Cloacimonas sp.]|jgi:cellulose synthase/poly-beta-1,6-N-acetylglucosamine synthase-like glycosyltransferase|nr:hypothetical protein [Candidatus Cloacimonadota bacterium]HCX72403.1 hypothetical protein [Candidatus Cloacimonas sp.]
MNTIITVLAGLYAAILLFFWLGNIFSKNNSKTKVKNKFSVIIAARNEANNLPHLLLKLKEQSYPTEDFEIIVANDRSTDDTAKILENWQNKLTNLKIVTVQKNDEHLVGKKKALQTAIEVAKYNIFAFTDADCLPGSHWLQELNRAFDEKTDLVAGYSPLLGKQNLVYKLKNLERAAIFAVTAGSFFWNWGITCTGRNLAYRRDIFQKSGGFRGIGKIRSGDDDLMLLKMRKYIRKMRFMFASAATVPAKDNTSSQAQINLETRRASKFQYYPADIKLLALLVFIFYLGLSVSFILLLLGNFSLKLFFLLLILKIIPEFMLISTFLIKIGRLKLISLFPLAELLYLPYFIFFALKGTWGKYRWKN